MADRAPEGGSICPPDSGITRSQAAAELGITEKTLYTWEKQGLIPAAERDWRGWRRYSPAQMRAIRAYRDARRGGPNPVPDDPARTLPVRADSPAIPISARNALRGIITSISCDGVLAEVVLDLGQGNEIVSVITRGSVERLGLQVGRPAVALIKATEVMLARE